MLSRKKNWAPSFFTFLFLLFQKNAEADLSRAKSFMEQLVSLASESKRDSGALRPETQQALRRLSQMVDYPRMASASLGAHWTRAKPGERADFLAVFQEILETLLFPKAARIQVTSEGLKYRLKETSPRGVHITGQLEREKRGDRVIEDLDLVLFFDSKTKKIVDAQIDGERLTVNLKKQFENALKKKKFAEVIAQMRKTVADAKAQKN